MAISIKPALPPAERSRQSPRCASPVAYSWPPKSSTTSSPFAISIKPGITTASNSITTAELDLCHDYMVDVQGCIPAPLNYAPPGYAPYPKSICASVNHQVCHGVPNDRALKKGDIVNLDITTIKDGWHGDTSRTFCVGETSILAKRLVTMTHECMWAGIAQVKPGVHLGAVGAAIQKHAEGAGLLRGAGILRARHRPQLP
jgi:methionine aminopeptidase